jgi:hypothetical protein
MNYRIRGKKRAAKEVRNEDWKDIKDTLDEMLQLHCYLIALEAITVDSTRGGGKDTDMMGSCWQATISAKTYEALEPNWTALECRLAKPENSVFSLTKSVHIFFSLHSVSHAFQTRNQRTMTMNKQPLFFSPLLLDDELTHLSYILSMQRQTNGLLPFTPHLVVR